MPTILPPQNQLYAGLKTLIRTSPNSAKNMSRIPGLWQELATLTANLPQRIGLEKYVLITGDLPDFPGSPFKPTAASTSETTDAVYYHALIAV